MKGPPLKRWAFFVDETENVGHVWIMSRSPVPGVGFFNLLAAEIAMGVVWKDDIVFFRRMVGPCRIPEMLTELPMQYPSREKLTDVILRPNVRYNNYVYEGTWLTRTTIGTQASGFVSRDTFEHSHGVRYLFDNGQWYYSQSPFVHHAPFHEAMDGAYCFDIVLSETDDGRWHVAPDILYAENPPPGMPTWKKFRQFLLDNDVRAPAFPTNNALDQIYVEEDIAGYIRLAYPKTHVWV